MAVTLSVDTSHRGLYGGRQCSIYINDAAVATMVLFPLARGLNIKRKRTMGEARFKEYNIIDILK